MGNLLLLDPAHLAPPARPYFRGPFVGRYRTLTADPPWPEHGGGQIQRGADRHYDLMSVADIAALPVGDLADPSGCHLWMWATGNYLDAAFVVLGAWGFEYINFRPWVKMEETAPGLFRRQPAGLGQYLACDSEILLFARRGPPMPYKRDARGKRTKPRQSILAPRTDEHSEKPDVYGDIEAVSHGPRIELFARSKRAGWDAWGNEVQSDVELVQRAPAPAASLEQLGLFVAGEVAHG